MKSLEEKIDSFNERVPKAISGRTFYAEEDSIGGVVIYEDKTGSPVIFHYVGDLTDEDVNYFDECFVESFGDSIEDEWCFCEYRPARYKNGCVVLYFSPSFYVNIGFGEYEKIYCDNQYECSLKVPKTGENIKTCQIWHDNYSELTALHRDAYEDHIYQESPRVFYS